MTPLAKRLLFAMLCLIGATPGLLLLYEACSERDAAQERTALLQSEFAYKQNLLANHDAVAADLAEMREMSAQLVTRLPGKFSPLDVGLRAQAQHAHLQVESLQLSAETLHEGFYADRRAEIALQGSTAHLLEFMHGIVFDGPIRDVRTLKIEPGEGAELRATMSIVHYRYMEYAE